MHAGPPFLTDDPEPVEWRHWELYIFGQGDRSLDGNAVSAPAIEFNYGIAKDTQLHVIGPVANVTASGSSSRSGYGDTEVGVKYRFWDEKEWLPQVGVFPMAELDTGDASRGLGNGRTWYRLPLWIQKGWGPWTTYGGGGVALNSAAGQRNFPFGGWLLQRDLGKFLTLGGELYAQGRASIDGRGYMLAKLGGYIKITDSFNLLFSGGRSISGERHTIWYLGLYWTGGPKESAQSDQPKG